MKNILIFAGVAGLASAVAIYFVTAGLKPSGATSRSGGNNFITSGNGYVSDADIEAYNINENSGAAQPV